jgi:hypothetical protein
LTDDIDMRKAVDEFSPLLWGFTVWIDDQYRRLYRREFEVYTRTVEVYNRMLEPFRAHSA